MNFFGHAAVVTRVRSDAPPATVLGAMLPDFLSMCGARTTAIDDDALAAGVALHHETDAAFHALPPFTGLVRDLGERLTHAGVSRGPMRGVAHAAVELFLDGTLVDDARACDAYAAAIDHDPRANFDEPERFAFLRTRLRAHGVPYDLREAHAIAARCLRMLAHRPLLAPKGDEPAIITRVLDDFARRARVAAPTIMHALRASMAASATPGAAWHPGSRAGSSGG